MRIAVGSNDRVKLALAEAVMRPHYGRVSADGLEVASARWTSLCRSGGRTGGLLETEHGVMTCGWAAVANRAGRVGLSGGFNLLLPPAVTAAVRAGAELGKALDAPTGLPRPKAGAIGFLTDGL